MQIDLYTLYLYSYAKEYLFNKNKDMTKLTAFSESSNCIFSDEFWRKEVLASNPMDFFKYLEKRECFKIELSKEKVGKLILECSCRFSLEHWTRCPEEENDGQLVFVKSGELLWATRYRSLTEDEIYNIRKELKIKEYIDK